jgi:hypothetical protein
MKKYLQLLNVLGRLFFEYKILYDDIKIMEKICHCFKFLLIDIYEENLFKKFIYYLNENDPDLNKIILKTLQVLISNDDNILKVILLIQNSFI